MGIIPVLDYCNFATKNHGPILEEIHGLLRIYKDGYVDRLPVVPEVPPSWSPEPDVVTNDTIIDRYSGVWARIYVPVRRQHQQQHELPVLVYFHGGGFCVGSAAWRCYHVFLSRFAATVSCIVISVNYRLAPEHRLPAAFDDGVAVLRWLQEQQHMSTVENKWWKNHSNFSKVFLGGDSAGATIAFNVALRVRSELKPQRLIKGIILIQPFIGGENRTVSEKSLPQPERSALTLTTSDCYWRLALPVGANRDHPWCNPLSARNCSNELKHITAPVMVCVSEMDILRDRNVDLCKVLKRAAGNKINNIEMVVFGGVGHAFQVLDNSRTAQVKTSEMLSHVKAFINNNR